MARGYHPRQPGRTIMLEIFLIVSLCKRMGEMMRHKGYDKPFWFQFFVPFAWLGGEFAGGFVYAFERAMRGQQDGGFGLLGYVVALFGAILSATLYFVIARSFSSPTPPVSES